MKYHCVICNYDTDILFSYNKHLKTQKHFINVTDHANSKQIQKQFKLHSAQQQKIIKKEINCEFCEKLFSSPSNLTRHKKTCPKKIKIETYTLSEIEKRDQEIIRLKEQYQREKEQYQRDLELREKMHQQMHQQRQEEIVHLKSLINNAGGVIKTSVSALSYVVKNYDKAPALKQIKDFSYLECADSDSNDDCGDENDLSQTIIKCHGNKTIVDYLGNIIVQAYKKDDPSKQSIWNSDATRLTYMIRELIDKKPDWLVDKKGVKTTKFIIDPLLEYIRQLMADFIEENRLENFLHESDWRMRRRMDDLNVAGEICYNIKNKILSEQLLKHIAPHFYLNKNDQLIDG